MSLTADLLIDPQRRMVVTGRDNWGLVKFCYESVSGREIGAIMRQID
ncbi:MAG: hypothetical protein ACK5CA_05285 [Cyanobacteriota bacterium]